MVIEINRIGKTSNNSNCKSNYIFIGYSQENVLANILSLGGFLPTTGFVSFVNTGNKGMARDMIIRAYICYVKQSYERAALIRIMFSY